MYHVEKNGIAFFTNDESQALEYMKNGYSVHDYVEMKIDKDGNLKRIEQNNVTEATGIITSDHPAVERRNEEK